MKQKFRISIAHENVRAGSCVFDGVQVSSIDSFPRLFPGIQHKSPAGRRLKIHDCEKNCLWSSSG